VTCARLRAARAEPRAARLRRGAGVRGHSVRGHRAALRPLPLLLVRPRDPPPRAPAPNRAWRRARRHNHAARRFEDTGLSFFGRRSDRLVHAVEPYTGAAGRYALTVWLYAAEGAVPPPPPSSPPSRTKWTRLVHPSVLIGHVSSHVLASARSVAPSRGVAEAVNSGALPRSLSPPARCVRPRGGCLILLGRRQAIARDEEAEAVHFPAFAGESRDVAG
jgi:hypothetical protein